MNVLPGDYIAAIDAEIAEQKKTVALNEKMGIKDTGVILGLEIARRLISRTYRGKQTVDRLLF